MDLLELISKRRSIRHYSSRPVEEEKLNKVLDAARLAPSARNIQNWTFIVVRDEKVKAEVVEISGNPFTAEAPVILVACSLDTGVMTCGHRCDTVDVSIAMSFALLQAEELGLGTCWIARYDEKKLMKALGVPDHGSIVMITPLGYPAESPDPRPRKTLEEVVRYDRFS